MSEFTKVLDRIHENLENGQPMFDGIEFKTLSGDWKQAICLDQRTELFRVKPVVTGMFDAEQIMSVCLAENNFIEKTNSLNEFVESKLPAIREQAIRDFIERIGAKYPNWQRDWLYNELSEMKNTPAPYVGCFGNPSDKPEGQLVKGPERDEPKPINEQTITVKAPHLIFEPGTPAPVMPEQRITIQPGDYVPYELITSEAVHELIVKCFVAAGFKDARPRYGVYRAKTDKGLGTDRDRDILWTDGSDAHERPLTLQQLFNATNGFEWPENTNTIIECLGRIEFIDSKIPRAPHPHYRILTTRVKSDTWDRKIVANQDGSYGEVVLENMDEQSKQLVNSILDTRVKSFTPEKATRRAIQPGDVLFLSDDIEISRGLKLALRDISDRANLNLSNNERRFYFQGKELAAPHSISIEEVFNAPNGLVWPEWATWLEISADSWCFVDDNTAHDDALLTIPRK